MGQYYRAYVENGSGAKVFCPQNAVYMTKNGISSAKDIGDHGWDYDDPNSWGANFSGLKLMEHSWLENDFVNGVIETIWDNPSRVAWVGDYADDQCDFNESYTENVYKAVWCTEKENEHPFDEVPTVHNDGYIVNLDKGIYIDLGKYAQVAEFTPSWDSRTWTIHPLPILTSVGNGRGGGDYNGTNMDMVGAWAMDTITFTKEHPSALKEVDYAKLLFIEG